MNFNNEQIIFLIRPLESEWILPVVLSYYDNCFYVSYENSEIKGEIICRLTIFHTIIRENSRFDISCSDFVIAHTYFESLIEPIFKKYCEDKSICLKFDFINYE